MRQVPLLDKETETQNQTSSKKVAESGFDSNQTKHTKNLTGPMKKTLTFKNKTLKFKREELEKMPPSEVDLLLKNRNVQKIANTYSQKHTKSHYIYKPELCRCNENETMSAKEKIQGNFLKNEC